MLLEPHAWQTASLISNTTRSRYAPFASRSEGARRKPTPRPTKKPTPKPTHDNVEFVDTVRVQTERIPKE